MCVCVYVYRGHELDRPVHSYRLRLTGKQGWSIIWNKHFVVLRHGGLFLQFSVVLTGQRKTSLCYMAKSCAQKHMVQQLRATSYPENLELTTTTLVSGSDSMQEPCSYTLTQL